MNFNVNLKRVYVALVSIILTLVLPVTAYCEATSSEVISSSEIWRYPIEKPSPQFLAYPVLPGSSLSYKIDMIVDRIFGTSTGRAFCEGSPEDLNFFSKVFFINKELASTSFQKCKGHFGLAAEYNARARTYYIAEDCKTNIDGWTTYNHAMICLPRKDPEFDSKLVKTILHEMIASNEEKQTFGNNNAQQSQLSELQNNCRASALYHNIQLQIALDTIRFYEIEKKISEELNLTNPPGLQVGKSCHARIGLSSLVNIQISLIGRRGFNM